MKKIVFHILFLLISFSAKAHDLDGLAGLLTEAKIGFNKRGAVYGADVSAYLVLLNFGCGVNNFAGEETKFSLYAGLGLATFVQLQYGNDMTYGKLRLTTRIPFNIFTYGLKEKGIFFSHKNGWAGQVGLLLTAESYFTATRYNYIGGGIIIFI